MEVQYGIIFANSDLLYLAAGFAIQPNGRYASVLNMSAILEIKMTMAAVEISDRQQRRWWNGEPFCLITPEEYRAIKAIQDEKTKARMESDERYLKTRHLNFETAKETGESQVLYSFLQEVEEEDNSQQRNRIGYARRVHQAGNHSELLMRKELRTLNGKRTRFTATVLRFGTKPAYRGDPLPTILLGDVRYNDTIVTDHIWFTCGKWSKGLKVGDMVSFEARVGQYVKGYQGRLAEQLGEERHEIDFRLQRPTKVQILTPVGEQPQISKCSTGTLAEQGN